MLGAILGAVEGAVGVATGNPALIAAGVSGVAMPSGLSSRDQARVTAANNALAAALNGDASQLAYMIQQSNNSATQVGKNAFKSALQQYYAKQAGAVAGTTSVPLVSAQTPLQAQVSSTLQNVRNDLAAGVQNIGAGATTTAANSISNTSSALTLPTNTKTLVIVGGAALGAFLIFSKHK